MNKDQFQGKLLETFKIEADEHLRSIVDGLLQLEKNPTIDEYVKTAEVLHREVHNLKGAARAVNLLDIELICQTIEEIFSLWKRKELKATPQQFDILHQTINMLQQSLARVDKENFVLDKQTVSESLIHLNVLLKSDTAVVIEKNPENKEVNLATAAPSDYMTLIQTVRIASAKLDTFLLKAEEMLTVKLSTKKYVNEFTKIHESIRTWKNEWNKTLRQVSSQSVESFLANGFNRIKFLESLVISLLSQFETDGHQLNGLIDGLLDDAKKMVMLPFSVLLDSFPAMVRNISREQGKEVNLILEGTEIEIDKRILEDLKDPLIHLIRNSIDHGIEKTGERKNKSTQGTIKVAISQSSGNEVEITISDDGYGIDLYAVKAAAIKQGLLSQDAAQTIDDQTALSLIYLSGISTSPIITNISGHGLGMAIVHEKIEKIGGRIGLKSERGVGTEITLTLPLAITTFKGVLIKVADKLLVMPTAYLERIIRIRSEDIKTVENKETIILDSMTLSLVKLHEVLGISCQLEKKNNQTYIPIAIIKFGENRAAFQVDEVHGEQEILVIKLNKPLVKVKYISAETILETGVPVLILSASDLIKAVIKDTLPQKSALISLNEEQNSDKKILVVEDSITTRMLLKNILEMAGYTVTTATDGAEAWRILRENEITLVVSDIEMPRMSGFELTKKIRSNKKFSDLPVVLVTGRESQEDRECGIDVGANAYIVKSSFEDSNLLAVIKRLL